MTVGPGKYDAALTELREKIGARGAALIVVEGDQGHGFSVQLDMETLLKMPEILEEIARQLRADRENVLATLKEQREATKQ